jgi:hypothetical protein
MVMIAVVNRKILSSVHRTIINLCLNLLLITTCSINRIKMKTKECMQVWSLWNHQAKRKLKGRIRNFKDFSMRLWNGRIG